MISVREYNDSDFEIVLEYCKEQSQENHPAASNMWQENWQSKPETLPFILNSKTRFDNKGKFFLLFEENKIIGCSGIYISDFSDKIAIAGARTWISRKYRTKQYVKDYLLPIQKDWAISNNVEIVALTFNDYNVSVIRLFTIGQATGSRSKRHLFSDNFNVLDFPVIIQYVPQWVIYENLTEYRFPWESIKAV